MTPRVGNLSTGPDSRTVIIQPDREAFMAGLVILSLANSLLLFLLDNREQQRVILIVQSGICVILLADALLRLLRAPAKRRFLVHDHGWAYLVGSLPIPFFFLVRLLPTWLMVHRLRRRDYEALGRVVISQRAQTTLLSVILVAIVVLEVGSISVLGAEWAAPDGNIKTGGDALWWAAVTIATVGYGDYFPTTGAGRVVGVFMMIVGVAVFTSLSSFLAQWFLRQRSTQPSPQTGQEDKQPASGASQQPAATTNSSVTWEQLRAMLDEREQAHQRELQELRTQLAELKDGQGPLRTTGQ